MNKGLTGLKHSAERQAASVIIDGLLHEARSSSDRTKYYLDILELAKKFLKKELTPENTERIRNAILDPDNRYIRSINRVIDETDPNYIKTTILNLGFEAFFHGTKTIRENRKLHGCNIPWLILFDPTNACNMHCAGCWSGTYGNKSNLSFEDMDRIVTQGKELGAYLYMMTGGEPLVRKNDILRLAEKHSDCYFAAYTNSTLIDEDLCRKVQHLGNLTFLLSIEGTPESNDARRGDGHYEAVMKAMDLLRAHGILFGTSICYTRENLQSVTSDDFFRLLDEKGARFGFYFHYMPTGKNAVPALMPTPEQRKYMVERIRYIRTKGDYCFYPMDFQNDGEYVGGCIAGGRNYFHINAAGDAEPCVFIHYSNANIHESSILEILKSPLFMEYHRGQPFNQNHLRPCPMLENPELLRAMVERSGAHQTNDEAPESADELCAKCDAYAREWEPVAAELWENSHK